MNDLLFKVRYQFNKYFKKPVIIPSYEVKRDILAKYKEKYNLNILIETGTFLGDTVEYFKSFFKEVISIELAEDLAKKAKTRFENDKNITIIQGDSGQIMKEIINKVSEPVLFWLDGHYSSEFFMGNEYIKTAKSNINTPVESELQVILGSMYQHVILIDDARLFVGRDDYPTLAKVKKMVLSSKSDYQMFVSNDIIQIAPL